MRGPVVKMSTASYSNRADRQVTSRQYIKKKPAVEQNRNNRTAQVKLQVPLKARNTALPPYQSMREVSNALFFIGFNLNRCRRI